MANPIRPILPSSHGRGAAFAEWLKAELGVRRVLKDAPGLVEAAPRLFGVLCPGLRMDLGVLWMVDHSTGALRAAYVWKSRGAAAPAYEAAVRECALREGEGLAGAAWAGMAPAWREARVRKPATSDVVGDAAREDGLRLGLAFPVCVGPEFHGAVELVAQKPRRDVEELEIAAAVLGETLGQFLVRQGTLQRLSKSERQLADLFANAPMGIVVTDARGRVLRANKAELDMLGYEPSAYVGHPLSDVHVDPAPLADLLARVARGEDVQGFETRVRRADGREIWVRIHANGSFEGGRLQQVRCFSRDVTSEREAERTLRESEERFRLLVEGARDYALHTYDAGGRVSAWSVGAQSLFGWTEGEATRLALASLFAPEDRTEDMPGRMLQLAEDEGRVLHEGWLVRKDGSRFWGQVSLTAVRDPSGRLTHVCQLTRDATESRRIEVLRRKTTDLESANSAVLLAQRRTTELLEGLRSAIEEPVRAIERLVAQLESGDVGDAVRTARASALALRRALDRAGAAGTAGPVSGPSGAEPLDPFRLASEVRDMLRDAAAERRVRVEVDVDPDVGPVVVPADRLRQILFNLVSNAIKYNRDRGRVSIRFLRESEDAVRLEVEDTGIGIPDDRLATLFDTRTDADGGGVEPSLGLPATRWVVADLGGRIAVRSALGRGSVFSVVLPRSMRVAAVPAAPAAEPPVEGPGSSVGRIVVVERDPAVRASLAWTFGGAGYEVATATSTADGIELAGSRRCDALAAALDSEDAGVVDVTFAVRAGGASRGLEHVICLVHGEGGPPGALLVSDVIARPAPADRLFAAVERARPGRRRGKHVLLVDGDLPLLQATARTLQALEVRVVAEPDADAALRAAADEAPAAVLLSPFPLGLSAFEFLHHLRRIPGLRDVPTILCAPRVLEEAQAADLRAAAACPEARLSDVVGELDRRLRSTRGVREAGAESI